MTVVSKASIQPGIVDAKIMIVDDVELSQKVLEKVLRDRGFKHITIANHGQEALDLARRSMPDMVILDVQMPVMDGFECCKQFRAMPQYRDTPIFMQTALTHTEARVKAFACGATDIVSKPVDLDEFYARVMVHLEKQHGVRELRAYHERTSMELESARSLQKAILPNESDLAEIKASCALDVAAHFQPSSEIGGDFWGMKKLSPRQVAFWMVDFSGHGVSAALNVFRLHAYLKDYSPHAENPGEYLAEMNNKLLELLMPGQFATMFYGIVDMQEERLLYASSGSPHPLIRRGKTGTIEMIDATGFPVGLGIHDYVTQQVAFGKGDSLVWYSDALTETPTRDGHCVSEEALMEIVKKYGDGTSANLVQQLVNDFLHQTNGEVNDDLTVVACRW